MGSSSTSKKDNNKKSPKDTDKKNDSTISDSIKEAIEEMFKKPSKETADGVDRMEKMRKNNSTGKPAIYRVKKCLLFGWNPTYEISRCERRTWRFWRIDEEM